MQPYGIDLNRFSVLVYDTLAHIFRANNRLIN